MKYWEVNSTEDLLKHLRETEEQQRKAAEECMEAGDPEGHVRAMGHVGALHYACFVIENMTDKKGSRRA